MALPGLALDGEGTALGEAFGRGGVYRVGDVVIRPYRRGGLMRRLNERTYPSPARFAREFLVHQALWIAGFPTVEPLGYAFRRRGLGVEGLYFTRFAQSEPWPRRWEIGALPDLRQAIAALCAWGLHSPDLNATNVMVTPRGEALLLDWDRAAWSPGPLLVRYQARLLRSLAKLQAPPELRADIERWRS